MVLHARKFRSARDNRPVSVRAQWGMHRRGSITETLRSLTYVGEKVNGGIPRHLARRIAYQGVRSTGTNPATRLVCCSRYQNL